jgi:hypothetical protein
MKVKALASLSTPNGVVETGQEFTVSAAEVEELLARGLVERAVAEPAAAEDGPTPKAIKAAKAKG